VRQQHLFGRIARPALALAIAVASVSCGDVVDRGDRRTDHRPAQKRLRRTASEEFDDVLASTSRRRVEDVGRCRRLAMKGGAADRAHVQQRHHDHAAASVRRRRNTPGVDVPHAFDRAITVTVSGSTAVRRRSPSARTGQVRTARPLTGLGGPWPSRRSPMSFYGRDQAGNDVSVTGTISVNFADWADED
jgi:hypothetical protein